MKKLAINFMLLFFLIFTFSCKKQVENKEITSVKTNIKYAKGFDIINKNGVKKLIIKSAYQNSKEVFEYIIEKKKSIFGVGYYLNSAQHAHKLRGWVGQLTNAIV